MSGGAPLNPPLAFVLFFDDFLAKNIRSFMRVYTHAMLADSVWCQDDGKVNVENLDNFSRNPAMDRYGQMRERSGSYD